MKHPIVLLILICISIAGMAHSQTADSLEGKKALMFSFNGLNLGGGFGAKYWISGSTALRFSLSGSYGDAKASLDDLDESESIDISVTPAIGIERHYSVADKLSAYGGGGVSYTFYSSQYKYDYLKGYSKSITDTYAGIIFMGVEYWLTKSISLAGEQQVAISYDIRTTNSGGENKGVNFANSTSRLQLSIYF